MRSRLAELEAKVERWIEGPFARLFAGTLRPRAVALRLAQVMEDAAERQADGSLLTPTAYNVYVNAETLQHLRAAHPDLEGRLAGELVNLARELGLVMAETPRIQLLPGLDLDAKSVRVSVEKPADAVSVTASMPRPALPDESAARPDAYLLIDGQRHVPLTQNVVSIGRQRNNVIVLDHPQVSRQHAQMRRRYDRWVLFDLGSRMGTFLNGERVDEAVLQPGDVITVAGFALIYGEDWDDRPRPKAGDTRPLPPPLLPDDPPAA